jgi:TP901 family phage tail tape measure protein
MAVSVGNIIAHLDVDDKMSRKMEAARKKFREVGDSAQKVGKKIAATGEKMTKMGNSARNAGVQLTAGLTLPIVALGAKALVSFANFEAGMNRVRAILGPNATQKDFRDLTATAEQLGRTTRFTAVEASEAMGFFALAGFKANEIMDAMPGTLDLAAAGQMEVAAAADIAAKTLRGYGMAATEVGRVSDVMAKAFTSANTDLSQLGEAMKYAGPVAKSAGIEFEDLTAAMALMADAGFQGTMGGTAVRGAIVRLLAPTKKASDIMKRLGISMTDATGRIKPFDEIIRQLEPHADKTGDMMVLFGQRAGPALAALVGRGSDAIVKLRSELRSAGGTTKRIADIQMEGLKGAFIELQSAVEGLNIAVGSHLAPTFESLLDSVKGVVNFLTGKVVPVFGKLPGWVQKTAIAFAGVIAAAGPLIAIFGQIMLGVGSLIAVFAAIGSSAITLTAVWAGMGVAVVVLGKILLAIMAIALVAYLVRAASAATGLTDAIQGLWRKLTGVSDAQHEAALAAEAAQEAMENQATAVEKLQTQLQDLSDLSMYELTEAFYRMSDANLVGRDEMDKFVAAALALKQEGKKISPVLQQLIKETLNYSEVSAEAELATIRQNQALAEAAERAAAVADAIRSVGFAKAREDLQALEDTWAGLSSEERSNIAVMTDMANSYDALTDRLGDDVSPELSHVRGLVKLLTTQYESSSKLMRGTPLLPPPNVEDLQDHVKNAFLIGDTWVQAIEDGIVSGASVENIVGKVIEPPPEFPEHMYTRGKVIGDNLATGFGESVAGIPKLLIDAFTGGGGLAGALKGIGTMFGAQIGENIFSGVGTKMAESASESGSKFMGSLAGMMGPIGAAIGALAGPMISGIVKLFRGQSTTERIQEAVTKQWGLAISDGLSEAIAKTADKIGSDWGGMMMHLADIFTEAGGVMAFGLDKAIAKTRDLFSAVAMGTLTVEQASESFGSSFQMIADAVVSTGRIASREFRELIELHRQFGFESGEMLAFIEQQSNRVFSGLATMIVPLQGETQELADRLTANADALQANSDNVAELTAKRDALTVGTDAWREADILLNKALQEGQQLMGAQNALLDEQIILATENKGALEAFGLIAVGAFGAAVQAGMSFVDAARLAAPAISAINTSFQNLGISSDNVAFQHLARWNDLILQNEDLVNSVDAFDDVLIGLSLTGGLTGDSLFAMGEIGIDQFNRLIEAGFTENEALLIMGPNIFALVDAYNELGIPIDDNTQRLLDMAIANGQVRPEDQVSGWQLVVDAINALALKLEALVGSIINVPDVHVGVDYSDPGFTPNVPGSVTINVDYTEGEFDPERPDSEAPRHYGRHGLVGNFGSGTLAMLHGNEAVIPLSGGAVPVDFGSGDGGDNEMLAELRALREEMELLPVHLRDAIITSQ